MGTLQELQDEGHLQQLQGTPEDGVPSPVFSPVATPTKDPDQGSWAPWLWAPM